MIIDFVDISEETLKEVKLIHNAAAPLIASVLKPRIISLHGQEINLGFERNVVLDPYVENFEAVMGKREKHAVVKSKSRSMEISYTKEPAEYPVIEL
jgi:hypothetical protein